MKRTYCAECLQLVAEHAASCPHCRAARPPGDWPDDPLIGAAVGGKYRVLRPLDRGAIGVVYLAVHVEFEAYRVLKVLDPRLAHDERVRRRFEREAKALYRLDPRHIVRLEDFGEVRPGLPFMALEYVEGPNLAALLRAEGPLPVRRALRLARQVAVALVDAAAEGVLHRDLRPENVLVRSHATRGDEVKVLDFGIAKILGEHSLTRTGGTTRTGLLQRPEYVAPELFTSASGADARADLFSLGVLLFELLAGQPPWPADPNEPLSALARMRDEPPRKLLELRTDLPDGVAELVARLLAKDPEGRPASAWEVVVELDRVGQLGTSAFDAIASGEVNAIEEAWGAAPSGELDDTLRTGFPVFDADEPMSAMHREAPTEDGLTGRGALAATQEPLSVRRWESDPSAPSRRGSAPTVTAEVLSGGAPPRAVRRPSTKPARQLPPRPRERGLLLGAVALLALALGLLAYALFGTLPTLPGAVEPPGTGAAPNP